MKEVVHSSIKRLWDHIDPVIALVLAIVLNIQRYRSESVSPSLVARILATMALIAFVLIRERSARDALRKRIDSLRQLLSRTQADTLFRGSADESELIRSAADLGSLKLKQPDSTNRLTNCMIMLYFYDGYRKR